MDEGISREPEEFISRFNLIFIIIKIIKIIIVHCAETARRKRSPDEEVRFSNLLRISHNDLHRYLYSIYRVKDTLFEDIYVDSRLNYRSI